MILYYYPQWLCICTCRFLKLFIESLGQFPWRLSSVPRLMLVSLLSGFTIAISYLHLTVVFIEQLILAPFISFIPYPTIFILGAPRSGTTRMHKLMAADISTFSAMKMWELFFAPSISQKLLLKGLGKIDGFFGAPFFKLIKFVERRVYKNFNNIHQLGLFNVEEDALILFHLFSSYHLSFLLGKEQSYHNLNYDKGVPKAVWAYYKICIDNHMRLNKDKIYLSKNPFFSASTKSLEALFGAPKFIYMNRDMKQVAPSFFSLKTFLHQLFYGESPSEKTHKIMFKTLMFWQNTGSSKAVETNKLNAHFADLTSQPIRLIHSIYSFLKLKPSPAYKEILKREAENAEQYKSKHVYDTKEFNFDGYPQN